MRASLRSRRSKPRRCGKVKGASSGSLKVSSTTTRSTPCRRTRAEAALKRVLRQAVGGGGACAAQAGPVAPVTDRQGLWVPAGSSAGSQSHLGQHFVRADRVDPAGGGANPLVQEDVLTAVRRHAAGSIHAWVEGSPLCRLSRRARPPAHQDWDPDGHAAHRCGKEALRKRKKSWG